MIQDILRALRMKADLIGAEGDHTLLPRHGYGAVNNVVIAVFNVVIAVLLDAAMIGGTCSAVMDETPKIIVVVVSSQEYERLNSGKRISGDYDFDDLRGSSLVEGDQIGPATGLSLKGRKTLAEIGFFPPQAYQDRPRDQLVGRISGCSVKKYYILFRPPGRWKTDRSCGHIIGAFVFT